MLTTNRKKTFRRIFSYKFGCTKKTLSDFLASYLFPHLLTKQGSKRSSVSRKSANDQLINEVLNNPVYNAPSLKQLASLALPKKSTTPQPTYQNIPPLSIKLNPETINPTDLQDIPQELLKQLFAN